MAGLAAARRLIAAGLDVTVLEARERIGGRIWSIRASRSPIAIELGAEFLHDAASQVRAVAREAGIVVTPMRGEAWTSSRGLLTPMDNLWPAVGEVFARLDANRTPDRSFAEALEAMPEVPAVVRRFALGFVEGFEAADPREISERSLARDSTHGASDAGEPGQESARIESGYDGIVQALATTVRDRIRLGTVATRVRWSTGHVEVECVTAGGAALPALAARVAVIAVPHGVLTAPRGSPGHLELDPDPAPVREALHGLVTGGAIRIALEFDEPFWRTRRFARRHGAHTLDSLDFLIGQDAVPFPTWWTAAAPAAPILIGWCGGPRAFALAQEPEASVRRSAVRSIAHLLGLAERTVARRLRGSHTHDWINDPFARGGYTYARVGGAGASAVLARPVQGTLHFAGEHVDAPAASGTVDRAIASGHLAAARVIEALVGAGRGS